MQSTLSSEDTLLQSHHLFLLQEGSRDKSFCNACDVLSRAPKLTALLPGVSGLAQLVGGDGEVELVGGVPLTECQPHCDPAHSALLSLHRESNKNFWEV